jgi:TolA-binding protein
MAAGIGISAPVLLAAPKSGAPAAKTGAFGVRALLPWISGAIVALAVGQTAVHLHPSANTAKPADPAAAAVSVQVVATATPPPTETAAPVAAPDEAVPSASAGALVHGSANLSAADLRAQITLIDAARAAVAAGAGDRALELLRQYQSRYSAGSFRPEASALKIEALASMGRSVEARTLAERFIVEHRGSPLAERVARITGISP